VIATYANVRPARWTPGYRSPLARPDGIDFVIVRENLEDLYVGLGLVPSGCYGDSYAYFESAHGSAPDIAGRNVINPTATILSATMMLDYLGFTAAGRRLEAAVERVYAAGRVLTPDQGGHASTTEFCDAVAQEL
jgi:3-isopropylmalate dehydrogenase